MIQATWAQDMQDWGTWKCETLRILIRLLYPSAIAIGNILYYYIILLLLLYYLNFLYISLKMCCFLFLSCHVSILYIFRYWSEDLNVMSISVGWKLLPNISWQQIFFLRPHAQQSKGLDPHCALQYTKYTYFIVYIY